MNSHRSPVRAVLLGLPLLLSAGCLPWGTIDVSNDRVRIDAALELGGLRVLVERRHTDPGTPQGGGESTGGTSWVRYEEWSISDEAQTRTIVSEEEDPYWEVRRRLPTRDTDGAWSLSWQDGGVGVLRDGTEVLRVSRAQQVALGRRAGQRVETVALMEDLRLRTWSAADGGTAMVERDLGAMPRPVGREYKNLVLAEGPVLGFATCEDCTVYGDDGEAVVWAEGSGAKRLGAGMPLAAWTSATGQKVAVKRHVTTPAGLEVEYAVLSTSGSTLLSGVLVGASKSGSFYPCAAATFTADGEVVFVREEAGLLRGVARGASFVVPLTAQQHVHQCDVFAEEGSSRVHLVYTTSPRSTVETPMVLHQVVVEAGAVVTHRQVDLTADPFP